MFDITAEEFYKFAISISGEKVKKFIDFIIVKNTKNEGISFSDESEVALESVSRDLKRLKSLDSLVGAFVLSKPQEEDEREILEDAMKEMRDETQSDAGVSHMRILLASLFSSAILKKDEHKDLYLNSIEVVFENLSIYFNDLKGGNLDPFSLSKGDKEDLYRWIKFGVVPEVKEK